MSKRTPLQITFNCQNSIVPELLENHRPPSGINSEQSLMKGRREGDFIDHDKLWADASERYEK